MAKNGLYGQMAELGIVAAQGIRVLENSSSRSWALMRIEQRTLKGSDHPGALLDPAASDADRWRADLASLKRLVGSSGKP